jgi:hypothetical protein
VQTLVELRWVLGVLIGRGRTGSANLGRTTVGTWSSCRRVELAVRTLVELQWVRGVPIGRGRTTAGI